MQDLATTGAAPNNSALFELNRVEGELEDSQQRLRTILATVQVGILIIDAESHLIVDANRKAEELVGTSRDEMVGRPCHRFLCPEEEGHCPVLNRGLKVDNAERVLVRSDGSRVTVLKTVAPLKLQGRDHLVESFLDISGRKRTEEALKASEEHCRELLDNANDLIQSVDHEGRFLYVNRAWRETMGYDETEIASMRVFDIITQECQGHCQLLFQRIMAGEKVGRVEVQFRARDGRAVELEGSISCNRHQDSFSETLGIFRDISERKALERQLQAWNSKLEQEVEAKTRHLKEAQAKLIQSEKMATLSEVIAGAAHELNNPLAGILGAIQMLRQVAHTHPMVPEFCEGMDVLEGIESAAVRCQRIVEDLVRFSTQARCNFSRMDLNQVLRDTLDIMADQFAQAGIQVTCDLEEALPEIDGDFVKLLEVFVNLLQNARNALHEGGCLDISTCMVKRYAEEPQVQIGIRDTGCGIPPQDLDKIFDPFFTTKPAGKGPGLGLTVSYGIIKRHRGDIDVQSTPGEGTEVLVTLPVRQPSC